MGDLVAYLAKEETKKKIRNAMDKIGTVHFARFVFLSKDQLAVITTYDGNFDDYIEAFVDDLYEVFNILFKYVKGADHLLPVEKHLNALEDFVKANDRSWVNGELQEQYCAYTLTVEEIRKCQKKTIEAV